MNYKKTRKRLATKIRAFIHRVKVRFYRLRMWIFVTSHNASIATRRNLAQKKLIYLSLFYVVASLVLSFWVSRRDLPVKDAVTFFTSAAAMIGATLAIIFSFSTLIINFANAEFPPEFYRLSGYDNRQSVIYFLVAVDSIALFTFALIFSSNSRWLMPLAVLIICKAFYLLFLGYVITRKRLNPLVVLGIVERRSMKYLDNSAKLAKRFGDVLAADPNLASEHKELARKQPFQFLKPNFEETSKIIANLHDYHDKLLAKQNFRTALKTLDTIQNILLKYIDIRHDNIQTSLSTYFLVSVTDSQSFFETNLQRLVDKAKRYMEQGNTSGAIHIAEMLSQLSQRASHIKLANKVENPLVEQIEGYLGLIADDAILQKDIEVIFRLAAIYGILGEQAVQRNYIFSRQPNYEQLVKIATFAAVNKETGIVMQVSSAFSKILNAIHANSAIEIRMDVKQLFDEYQKVVMMYRATVPDGMNEAINITPSVLWPYQQLYSWSAELAHKPATQVDRGVQSDFIELAEIARRSMRTMSDTISLSDHTIGKNLGDIIQKSAELMIDVSKKRAWSSRKEEIIKQARWYIHQLTWLKEKTKNVSDYSMSGLVDNAGFIGMHALEKGISEIAKESITVISNLARFYIEHNDKSFGYEAPRLMEVACYVGVYAQKLGIVEVVEACKEEMAKFNTAYVQKYFPNGPPNIPPGVSFSGPYPDQLLRELSSVQFNGYSTNVGYIPRMNRSIETVEDKMISLVTQDDLTAFIQATTPPTPPASNPS